MLSISSPPPSAQYLHGGSPGAAPAGQRHGTPQSPLHVVVSLDVEEEGLFSGQYAVSGCSVRNVSLLQRLEPLSRELGFPLTLLCAHTVFADADSCRVLEHMRDAVGAEIGAHLHHWSTPPHALTAGQEQGEAADLRGSSGPDASSVSPAGPPASGPPASGPPERSHRMDKELLRARLRTLLKAGQDFQGAPLTSFRMGRWDLRASVRPLLAEEGILVDSSVCPLRAFDAGRHGQVADGPDHFLAPADPYWIVDPEGAHKPLLEAPITQLPWSPWLARAWYGCMRGSPRLDHFKFFGALSPNPVWHGEAVMRMATRLHVARGGRVLSLFWHSSEMLPGGSPHVPDQRAADALLLKIARFLTWLRTTWTVRGVTLTSLYGEPGFPALSTAERQGDW